MQAFRGRLKQGVAVCGYLSVVLAGCTSPEDGRPRGGGPGGDGGNYRAKPIHAPSKIDGTKAVVRELRENALTILWNRVAGAESSTPQSAGLGSGASLCSASGTQMGSRRKLGNGIPRGSSSIPVR